MTVYITIHYPLGHSTIESRDTIMDAYQLIHAYMMGDVENKHGAPVKIEIEIVHPVRKHIVWDERWTDRSLSKTSQDPYRPKIHITSQIDGV